MLRNLKHPLIDSEVDAALRDDPAEGGTPTGSLQSLNTDGIQEFREKCLLQLTDYQTLEMGGRIHFEEIEIPGFDGDPNISAIVLRPADLTDSRPAICLTHCGGKIVSHPRLGLHEIGILEWVLEFRIILVVAAVRVGPEDQHPAQVRDGYAALSWVTANAGELGVVDGDVSLAGFSGGGGVAAATALYARDNGGPRARHLILITPMLDDRDATTSNQFEGVIWDQRANRTGWHAMLGNHVAGPDVSPYAAPSRAKDLSGMPPTYLDAGSADTFRDETIDFGARLAEAGVPVDLHIWAGAMHGSEGLAPKAEVSVATVSARNSYLRRAFTRNTEYV